MPISLFHLLFSGFPIPKSEENEHRSGVQHGVNSWLLPIASKEPSGSTATPVVFALMPLALLPFAQLSAVVSKLLIYKDARLIRI